MNSTSQSEAGDGQAVSAGTDRIIRNAGAIAEEAMLSAFTDSAAFWAAFRRKTADELEGEFPVI